MNSTPQSASARVGGWRIAPDIAPCPRGSRISSRRRSSISAQEVRAALEHRRAGDRPDAARDDARGHSLRVRVDGGEVARRPHATAGALQRAQRRGEVVALGAAELEPRRAHRAADRPTSSIARLEVLHELRGHVEARERQHAAGRSRGRGRARPRGSAPRARRTRRARRRRRRSPSRSRRRRSPSSAQSSPPTRTSRSGAAAMIAGMRRTSPEHSFTATTFSISLAERGDERGRHVAPARGRVVVGHERQPAGLGDGAVEARRPRARRRGSRAAAAS